MKTDSHIRTQCFSLTRKDDGSVKIWNRDEEEIKIIKEILKPEENIVY